MPDAPSRLLVVEDNRTDVVLLRLALEHHKVPYEMTVLEDGPQAVAYLGQLAGEPPPSLAIIDLNLPKMDGLEVIAALRGNPAWGRTPVVILTTSDSPAERENAAGLDITAFIRKPIDLDGFLDVGRVIRELLSVIDSSR